MKVFVVPLFGWRLGFVLGRWTWPDMAWQHRQMMRKSFMPGAQWGEGFWTYVWGERFLTINWRRT